MSGVRSSCRTIADKCKGVNGEWEEIVVETKKFILMKSIGAVLVGGHIIWAT